MDGDRVMAVRCWLGDCNGHRYPGTTYADMLTHEKYAHTETPIDLNGPNQSWHQAALNEVRRLAKTGAEFTIWQVAQAVGDPDNHKTKLGTFAGELDHLGLAHVVRYDKSLRPGSKSSAAAVWRGGPNPSKEAAA